MEHSLTNRQGIQGNTNILKIYEIQYIIYLDKQRNSELFDQSEQRFFRLPMQLLFLENCNFDN